MNELRILEEIRDEFVGKFENDPQVKRICNVMINEFKARKKALTLTDVSQQRELLNALADDFNNSTDTYVGQTRIEEVLKAFNCA